jgi:SAM-dependent methyltransferase
MITERIHAEQVPSNARAMANAEQIRVWNEVNADRWLRLRAQLTAELAPFGDAAIAALDPRPGETALDVGCGFGETTIALARRTGDALGIDITAPFLEVARREAAFGARYLLADAQVHRFEEKFALCFSRFGLMFFEDPPAALANLRSAMRAGGRFAAVVWGPFEENDWARIPLRVVQKHLAAPDPAPGPGPFGLSDRERLVQLLSGAGFAGVNVARLDLPFATDVSLLLQTGPAASALRKAGDAGERLRPRIETELREALQGKALRGVALLATAL